MSKKTKFTPGPWYVVKHGGRIEIKMGGSSIALADTSEDMRLANLISAAPEMYHIRRNFPTFRNCGNGSKN